MKKSIFTKQQATALLVTLRKEVSLLLANSPDLDKLKDGIDRKKRIVEDLTYLVKEGYKLDPEAVEIYEIFNSK